MEVLEPIKSGAGASKWRPRFQEAGTVPHPWEFFPVLVFQVHFVTFETDYHCTFWTMVAAEL